MSLTQEQSAEVSATYAREGSEAAIQLAARYAGTMQWPVAAKIVDGIMDRSPFTVLGIDTHEKAPIGSEWVTEAGNHWRVIRHAGDYVTLERVDRPGDTYSWHVSSLTQTTARRVA